MIYEEEGIEAKHVKEEKKPHVRGKNMDNWRKRGLRLGHVIENE